MAEYPSFKREVVRSLLTAPTQAPSKGYLRLIDFSGRVSNPGLDALGNVMFVEVTIHFGGVFAGRRVSP